MTRCEEDEDYCSSVLLTEEDIPFQLAGLNEPDQQYPCSKEAHKRIRKRTRRKNKR